MREEGEHEPARQTSRHHSLWSFNFQFNDIKVSQTKIFHLLQKVYNQSPPLASLSSELLCVIESLLWHDGRLWLVVAEDWLSKYPTLAGAPRISGLFIRPDSLQEIMSQSDWFEAPIIPFPSPIFEVPIRPKNCFKFGLSMKVFILLCYFS